MSRTRWRKLASASDPARPNRRNRASIVPRRARAKTSMREPGSRTEACRRAGRAWPRRRRAASARPRVSSPGRHDDRTPPSPPGADRRRHGRSRRARPNSPRRRAHDRARRRRRWRSPPAPRRRPASTWASTTRASAPPPAAAGEALSSTIARASRLSANVLPAPDAPVIAARNGVWTCGVTQS